MLRQLLLLVVTLALLSGCTKDSDDPFVESGSQSPAPYAIRQEIQTEACSEGEAIVTVEIENNTTSFQIVTRSPARPLRINQIVSPTGEIIFDRTRAGDSSMSNAGEFQSQVNTFTYPIFSTLPTVTAGLYTINYELDESSEPSILQTTVLTKRDADLNQGILNINLIYAGPISEAYASKIAISEAMEFAKWVFKNANVDLRIVEYNIPEAPARMPDPIAGDPLYEEFAKITGPGINLYMAAEVANLRVSNYESATTGSNPGPFIPTARSAVVISINEASGSDGLFNGGRDIYRPQDIGKDPKVFDETKVMAESITKELLRYLGLAHSVEFKGNSISKSDIIDSPKCNSKTDCFNDRLARHNIMFPEPATGRKWEHGRNEFILYPRLDLSNDQIAMINRSVGVQ